MRAYLLGYSHGKDDGYYSTLIERGGCEKSYDESLDVEYMPIDDAKQKVLDILEEMERSPAYTKVADGDYIGSVLTNTGIIREKINEL